MDALFTQHVARADLLGRDGEHDGGEVPGGGLAQIVVSIVDATALEQLVHVVGAFGLRGFDSVVAQAQGAAQMHVDQSCGHMRTAARCT